ncbi:exopolysaccharide biosynthesis protein [Xinfangfangia sp. D13-10-4-6]|uniref:exopolysaccharide biosynthesis protein n=1 Tax=Pseudogemmobacter hezensis TaxID=2737662 RepID=UPI001551F6E4|nr:exopolysaccharide biosynthesis protein [Pseudogemmobacter hezensis]NPD15938.1 exopolysaccharide biosynthesis protein [Pseudogemmobacter hezensis]
MGGVTARNRDPDTGAKPSAGRPADQAPPSDPASAPPSDHNARPGLTAVLEHLARDPIRERISVGDMLETMRSRAFGAMLLVFAFPNILPTPPGVAGILGMPLIFLSAQMMLGRQPWLPEFITKRSMERSSFAAMVTRVTPWLRRAEALMHPRLTALSSPRAQQGLGLVCLILAIALALPIPFANLAPAAAISVLGLGILQRDGLWITLGLLGGVVAVGWVASLGYALVWSALFAVDTAF